MPPYLTPAEAAHAGKVRTPEEREKIAAGLLSRKQTEAHKEARNRERKK